jgi:hypothetical protein
MSLNFKKYLKCKKVIKFYKGQGNAKMFSIKEIDINRKNYFNKKIEILNNHFVDCLFIY